MPRHTDTHIFFGIGNHILSQLCGTLPLGTASHMRWMACKNAWGNTGAELPLPKPWRCFKLEASQVPGYYGLKTALSVLETKFSGTKKLPQKRAEKLLSKAQCLQRSGDSAVKSWPHWHNFPSWKLPFQGKLGPDAKKRWVRKPGLEIAKTLGRVYWLYPYFGGFLCTKHMGSR